MNARMTAAIVGAAALLLAVGPSAAEITIETVHVGDPGNAGQLSGQGAGGGSAYGPNRICGAVDYEYNIGKYEVTAGQYCEFLNAVADTDTYGVYNGDMWSDTYGCKIQRSGSSGSYTYGVAANWANRPVNFVDWGDAARFANWLHNGQPTGAQDLTTTEDGAYYLNGATTNEQLLAVVREPDWKWAVTSEDEWYKAAYYNPATGTYYRYPTSSNGEPGYVDGSGNLSGTGTPFVEGGTDPGNYATQKVYGVGWGIGSPYYRTEVGEWENSPSPYGTFDQGGNVYEWNDTVVDLIYRGLRGGSCAWYGFYQDARFRAYLSVWKEGSDVGFRISQVPEPATLGLLALGGLIVLRRKRR
jgi:sulfatase modifying factor 1